MKISNEAKTGILVILAIGAVILFYVKTTDFNVVTYKVKTFFNYADGIKQDSIVKLSGIEVGRVSGIRFQHIPETKVEVELTLNKEALLHEDSIAFIATSGMIGDAYIGITPGSAEKNVVRAGAVITSEDPMQLRKFWKKADMIADSLDDTLADLKSLTNNVNGLVSDSKPRMDSIMMNIEQASVNFKDFSQDIKRHPWKLLIRTKK